MTKLPTPVKIVDVIYKIEYVDKPSEVDVFKRESLWGRCDFWTDTIRIYSNGHDERSVRHTLWHEILHAMSYKLKIHTDDNDLNNQEKAIDLLATGINCLLYDNPELREIG